MTLESAAVEFLRAYVAWTAAKRATQGLPCTNREPTTYLNGGVLDFGLHDCLTELGSVPSEDFDEWCPNAASADRP